MYLERARDLVDEFYQRPAFLENISWHLVDAKQDKQSTYVDRQS